jgi:hypothetical protein
VSTTNGTISSWRDFWSAPLAHDFQTEASWNKNAKLFAERSHTILGYRDDDVVLDVGSGPGALILCNNVVQYYRSVAEVVEVARVVALVQLREARREKSAPGGRLTIRKYRNRAPSSSPPASSIARDLVRPSGLDVLSVVLVRPSSCRGTRRRAERVELHRRFGERRRTRATTAMSAIVYVSPPR